MPDRHAKRSFLARRLRATHADRQNVRRRAACPRTVAAASPESAERMVECSLNSQGVEVSVMTTLFSTRTSLGRASAEKRGIGRTVMLALVAVLALIVVTAAVFGAAPALAGAVAAVILLI